MSSTIPDRCCALIKYGITGCILTILNLGAYAQAIQLDSLTSDTTIVSIETNNISSEIIKHSLEDNFLNALNTKIPGLQITSTSGSPGASTSVRIRGNRSVLFENSPLILLDGHPIDNSSLAHLIDGVDYSSRSVDINPHDIADIQILKSAYANVLYGIRGANGVIEITSKKGIVSKRPRVNFSYGLSFDKVNKLPALQTIYAQGRNGEYRDPSTGEGSSWGPLISDLEYETSPFHPNAPNSDAFFDNIYGFDSNGFLVPRGAGMNIPANAYDNTDNFFVTAPRHDLNVSVFGGSPKINYRFSAEYLNHEGVVPSTDFKRKSLRLNSNANILDNLTAAVSVNFVNSGSDNRAQRGSNISGIPLGLFRTSPSFDNGNGLKGKDALVPEAFELPDGTQRAYRYSLTQSGGIYDNPYWSLVNNPNDNEVNRWISSLSLDYTRSDFLLSYKVGIDHWNEHENQKYGYGAADQSSGQIMLAERSFRNLNSDLSLTHSLKAGKTINIKSVIGHNYYYSKQKSNARLGSDFMINEDITFELADDLDTIKSEVNQKLAGLYAMVTGTFDNYLTLDLRARNDWSSVLSSDNNSFLSYGIGLTLDLMPALRKESPHQIQINVSYGKTGNQPGAYLTSTYYESAHIGGSIWTSGIQFPQFSSNGIEPKVFAGNPNLRPEVTSGVDIGLDYNLFKNRIFASYRYYHQLTTDVVLETINSFASGAGNTVTNAAEITNKGHEISLQVVPMINKFKWSTALNFTKNNSNVDRLHIPTDVVQLNGFVSSSSNVVVNQPYGALYGRVFERTTSGELIIDDEGWPVYEGRFDYIGNPNPDWILGISNNFQYGPFSLGIFIDVRHGMELLNRTQGVLDFFGVSQHTADRRTTVGYVFNGVNVLDDGTEIVNNIPVDFSLSGNRWTKYGFGGLAEEYVQDASWIRLREISFSYQLPKKWINKIGIKSGSLTFSGRNLWLNTNYTGVDPETNLTGVSNGFGIDYFNLPNTKSYGLTFNFNL